MRSLDSTTQRAFKSGNPVVDGNRATFIWEGHSAPQLISDLADWENQPKQFKRVSSALKPSSDETIWSCSVTLPRDAYIEYGFYDPISQEKFLDPL
jgi:enterochelin esterase family protein